MHPAKSLGIACFCSFLLLASCSQARYYERVEGVAKAPCFSNTSIPDYMQDNPNVDREELASALGRINGIYTDGKTGIYNNLFNSSCDKDDKDNPDKRNTVTTAPDSDIVAYVNVFGQPLTKSIFPSEESSDSDEDEANNNDNTATANNPKNSGNSANSSDAGDKDKKSETPQNKQSLLQTVQLVVSSYIYSLKPANRLEKAYTLITPLHGGVEFVRAESPDKDISKAKVDVAKETSKGSISATVSTITPSIEESLERSIAKQFVIFNVEVFPLRNILLISQEGGPSNASIGGNVSAETVIKIPADLCTYYDVLERIEQDDSDSQEVVYAENHTCYIKSVKAVAASFALARAVKQFSETVKEDDDVIRYMTFPSATIVELWRNPLDLYGIKFVAATSESPVVYDVSKKPLVLRDFSEAVRLSGELEHEPGHKASIKVNGKKEKETTIEAREGSTEGSFQVCVFKPKEKGLSKPLSENSDGKEGKHHIEKAHDGCPE